MKELTFVQVTKDNQSQHHLFLSSMIPRNKELDSHRNRETPLGFIQQVTQGMINMQRPHESETLIGFIYCKVDHLGH